MNNKERDYVEWATGSETKSLQEAADLRSMYEEWIKQTKAIQKELRKQGAIQASKVFEKAYMESSKVML